MPHWRPGNRFVTAAASRCAVLCRYSGSASGLLSVTMRTEASASSGNDEIDQLLVHDGGERGLGQARRDPFRDVPDRRAGGDAATGTIRKRDRDLTHRGTEVEVSSPAVELPVRSRHKPSSPNAVG